MDLDSWERGRERRDRVFRWILRIGCLAVALYGAIILTMLLGFVRT